MQHNRQPYDDSQSGGQVIIISWDQGFVKMQHTVRIPMAIFGKYVKKANHLFFFTISWILTRQEHVVTTPIEVKNLPLHWSE